MKARREGRDAEAAALGAPGDARVERPARDAGRVETLPAAGAIRIRTELPGPRSRALREERRRWVSNGVSDARHGVFFERAEGARMIDADGNVFLDLSGGIGCMNAGHS